MVYLLVVDLPVVTPDNADGCPSVPQAAAEASAAQPSGEEADRQAKAVARLRSDLQRKESLLRASQAQLDEVGEGVDNGASF